MDSSYGNSFGSFSSGGGAFSQPVVSGGGEVVLAPQNGGKKGKRWLVIFILLAIVAAGVVAAVLLLNNKENNNDDVYGAFNRYGNYFIYGTDSNEAINTDIDSADYHFYEIINSSEDASSYLTRLYDLFMSFNEKYEALGLDDEYLNGVIKEYKGKLELVRLDYVNGSLGMDYVLAKYLSTNEEQAARDIGGILDFYKDLPDFYGMSYYDYLKSVANSNLELAVIYNEMGCVKDGLIDYVCVYDSDNEGAAALSSGVAKNLYYLNFIVLNSEKDLGKDLLTINNQMQEDLGEE